MWDKISDLTPTQLPGYFAQLLDLFCYIIGTHPFPIPKEFLNFLQETRGYPWVQNLPPESISSSHFIREIMSRYQQPQTSNLVKDLGISINLEKEESVDNPAALLKVFLKFLRAVTGVDQISFSEENFQRSVNKSLIGTGIENSGKRNIIFCGHYIDLVLSLFLFCFSPSCAASVLEDIFSVISGLAHPSTRMDTDLALLQNTQEYMEIVFLLQKPLGLYNVADAELFMIVQSTTHKFIRQEKNLAHMVLRAAQLMITEVTKQVPLTEICLENDFENFTNWNRLVYLLLVPSINYQIYLNKAVESGALITLFTFSTQICQHNNVNDICQLQQDMFDWLHKIQIEPKSDTEEKIVLLWEKFLQLTFWRLQNDPENGIIIGQLETFAFSLLKLAEDRKGGGIFGIIGLGDRSNFRIQFRLAARILAVFIVTQLRCSNQKIIGLRLQPTDPFAFSAIAQKELKALASLIKSSEYQNLSLVIQNAVSFLQEKDKTLGNVHNLVLILSSAMYKGHVKKFFHYPW